jgi:hypothetical protein
MIHGPVEISESLTKIADKVGPVAVGRATAGDHHIVGAASGAIRKFGAGQSAQTPPRPIATHRVADFS